MTHASYSYVAICFFLRLWHCTFDFIFNVNTRVAVAAAYVDNNTVAVGRGTTSANRVAMLFYDID